jgi:hypothetical protein
VNKYLIIVTQASCFGEVMEYKMLRVEKLEFICLGEK